MIKQTQTAMQIKEGSKSTCLKGTVQNCVVWSHHRYFDDNNVPLLGQRNTVYTACWCLSEQGGVVHLHLMSQTESEAGGGTNWNVKRIYTEHIILKQNLNLKTAVARILLMLVLYTKNMYMYKLNNTEVIMLKKLSKSF